MSSIKNTIGRNIVTFLYYAFRVFPVKKNKIFVKNFLGRGYGDSPKYIINYLLQNYQGFDVVWSVKDNYCFPPGIRVVYTKSIWGMIKSIYEQVTAKVWIDNSRKFTFERKRKNQYYIQTWHGDIGIKKAEGDAIEKMPTKEILNGRYDSKMADLFVCGNEWMCQRYREAYWYYGEIATCGLPRRDILYNVTDSQINEIKKSLGIPVEARLLLYVPTFRDNNVFNHRLGNYTTLFNWESVLSAMRKRFGGEWYGLMRLHPNAEHYSKELVLPKRVINVTHYSDVDELYCISDCCVSDYSSSLFEFGVTKKPGFIFAPDKEKYEGERGYYFTDDLLPFSVSTDMNSLLDSILSYDEDTYFNKHRFFYKEIIRMCPEGHASEYLAKRIDEVCRRS